MNKLEQLPGVWIKDGYFYRHEVGYGLSKGDILFETAYIITLDEDISEWSFNALHEISYQLNKRRRWPERMDSNDDAKTWTERIVNRINNKLFGTHLPFRFACRMVRDSFIALYTALIVTQPDSLFLIEETRPPLYVYNRKFYHWRQYLITRDKKHLRKYRRIADTSKKDFVIRLNLLMDLAVEKLQSL